MRYTTKKVVSCAHGATTQLTGTSPHRRRIRFTLASSASNTVVALLGNQPLASGSDPNGTELMGAASGATQTTINPTIFEVKLDGDVVTREWHVWITSNSNGLVSVTESICEDED
jgi:hypothetical protein